MYKKSRILLSVILIALFFACLIALVKHERGSNKQPDNTTETETVSTSEETIVAATTQEEDPDAIVKKLTALYRAGIWDGSKRRMEDNNVYYINSFGILKAIEDVDWSQLIIPDAPDDVKIAFGSSVRLSSASGIIAVNTDYTEITHYSYGKVVSSHKISGKLAEVINGWFEILVFGDRVAVKEGQHMVIYRPLDNWVEDIYDNVIDFCVVNYDGLMFSTFEDAKNGTVAYKNYLADKNSSQISLLTSSYIQLPHQYDEEEIGIPGYGRAFYVGTSADGKWFYTQTNADERTYTLYYEDFEAGVTKTISEDVLDAEGDVLGCYFIDGNKKLYYVGIDCKPKISNFSGTIYTLTPAISENDPPCVLTAEKDANFFASNGWDNLYNLAKH